MYLYFLMLFIFYCTGSSLLQRLFSPSRCGKRGLLSSCCEWASRGGGFSCCRAHALEPAGFSHCGTGLSGCGSLALEPRLSSRGTWAWLLQSMWHLPGSGVKPMSPALAGGFFTTSTTWDAFPFKFNRLLPFTI